MGPYCGPAQLTSRAHGDLIFCPTRVKRLPTPRKAPLSRVPRGLEPTCEMQPCSLLPLKTPFRTVWPEF